MSSRSQTAKAPVTASRYGFPKPNRDDDDQTEIDPSDHDAAVSLGVAPAVAEPVAPEPITARRGPAPIERPQRQADPAPRQQRTPVTPVRPSNSNSLGVVYTLVHGDGKTRDTSSQVSTSLIGAMEQARVQWSALHYDECTAVLAGTPRSSAFREALIRVGLKHMADDPEFIHLIPTTDGRRR